MLQNMFVGKPPGNHDRILDFSTAVTGSLFFVPSAAFLDEPDLLTAPATGAEAPAGDADLVSSGEDGTLGIGDLGAAS